MSDHKAEAERLLAEAKDAKTGGEVEASRQMHALVSATLYLAEQQRIGNFIAYMALSDESHERASDIWPLINEGLGL